MPDRKLKPLTTIGLLIALVVIRWRKGESRETLQRRIDYTRNRSARWKAHKRMNKQIKKEVNQFWEQAQNCFVRQGEAHISTRPDLGNEGRRVRKPKVHKIQCERAFCREEMIWYKILVNKRRFWRTRNMLPYGVRLKEALSPDSLFELSFALNRVCTAKLDDPRGGAYLLVHRLEGFDGLKVYLPFNDCLEHYPIKDLDKAPVILGYEENAKFKTVTFAENPHILVAGTSGSGKSNMLNQILCGWFRFVSPDDLRIVLIDLKKMEFAHYSDMPHLLEPTITDTDNVIRILSFAISEVLTRAEQFKGQVKELSQWNRRHPKHKIPRIVIVIDEYAELMLGTTPRVKAQISILIQRLVNLGRAVGVHLLIATQRPAVEVLPNNIKVNMGLRITGRVGTPVESATIIGTGAAAKLPLVPGRMVYLIGADIHNVQTPHITDDDIIHSLEIARGRQAGVITLDGWEEVIDPDGLFLYVADCLEGILKPEVLIRKLKPLGVPQRGLRAWLLEVISNRDPREIRGRSFQVAEYEDFFKIVEILKESPPAPSIFEFGKAIPALVGRSLQLTAGGDLPDQGDPIPPIAPPPPPEEIDPLTLSPDELLDRFIAESCDTGDGRYKAYIREMFDLYSDWIRDLNPLIIPLSIKQLGQKLGERGYPQGRSGHLYLRKRIRIKPKVFRAFEARKRTHISPIDEGESEEDSGSNE